MQGVQRGFRPGHGAYRRFPHRRPQAAAAEVLAGRCLPFDRHRPACHDRLRDGIGRALGFRQAADSRQSACRQPAEARVPPTLEASLRGDVRIQPPPDGLSAAAGAIQDQDDPEAIRQSFQTKAKGSWQKIIISHASPEFGPDPDQTPTTGSPGSRLAYWRLWELWVKCERSTRVTLPVAVCT